MNEQLKHIFDISACPTQRQVQDYLSGTMPREEMYVFEHHIHSCILCSEALDGFLEQPQKAITGLAELNNTFLKDHLELHPPQIYLNSIAHTAAGKDAGNNTLWKPLAIAATLLLCLGLGWYFKNYRQKNDISVIAQLNTKDSEIKRTSVETANQSRTANDNRSLQEEEKKNKKIFLYSEKTDNTQSVSVPQTAPEAIKESAPKVSTPALQPANFEKDESANSPKKENAEEQPVAAYREASSPPSIASDKRSEAISEDDNSKKEKSINIASAQPANESNDNLADNYYQNGNYSKALTEFKKQIRNRDVQQSQYAQLMTARCYLQLGEQNHAKEMLEELAENGNGSYKRQARRLLRQIKDEQ